MLSPKMVHSYQQVWKPVDKAWRGTPWVVIKVLTDSFWESLSICRPSERRKQTKDEPASIPDSNEFTRSSNLFLYLLYFLKCSSKHPYLRMQLLERFGGTSFLCLRTEPICEMFLIFGCGASSGVGLCVSGSEVVMSWACQQHWV